MNWTNIITDCIANDSKRHLLKGIPLFLIATRDYIPDFIYFTEYIKLNIN